MISSIEDLVYSAETHGKRTDLLNRVGVIRANSPSKSLEEVYTIAYEEVMNVQNMIECVICNADIKDFGHNPDPINEGKGRCCDSCNFSFVIPARIYSLRTNNI